MSRAYTHTRGRWRHNELAWAVLCVLEIMKQNGSLPLRVKAIQELTGCNYFSLIRGLPKWESFGWIKRYKPKRVQPYVQNVYTYGITPKGIRRRKKMQMPKMRGLFNIKFDAGIDAEAMQARLPIFRKG